MQDQLKYLYEKYQLKNLEDIESKFIELSSISEMNERFKKAQTLRDIANLLLLVPMGRLLISKSIFIIFYPKTAETIAVKGKWENTDKITPISFNTNQIIQQFSDPGINLPENLVKFAKENQAELLIPLLHQGDTIGMALLGRKLNQSKITQSEISFLQTIFDLATPVIYNAIIFQELQTNNQRLDNHIQLLNTIFDTVKGFTFNLDEEKIVKIFYFTLMGQLSINKFFIANRENVTWKVLASKGMDKIDTQKIFSLNDCYKNKEPYLYLDEELRPINEMNYSYVCIPYSQKEQLASMLILGRKLNDEPLQQYEIEFSQILLSQTISSVNSIKLIEEKIEKEKMERELQVAHKIQNILLPSSLPVIDQLDLFAYNEPSKEVGGDYYDVIKKGNILYFTIADVSGKSVPASILMSNLQSALHLLLDFDLSLVHSVEKLNRLIYQNTTSDKYITFFLGKLNLESYDLEYVNAGHNPPVLYNKDSQEFKYLDHGGIILGMFPEFKFESRNVTLNKNDMIFLFTDGVTETINENDDEWGDENLNQFLIKHTHLPASEISASLLKTLNTFKGKIKENYDDITYIIIKRN